MTDLNHRKEVLEEVERLGIFEAIDCAENLVCRVRREATAAGMSDNGDVAVAAHSDEDVALAAWAQHYAASEEGKRVSALIDVRLRAMLGPLVTSMGQSTAEFVHERIADAVRPLIAEIAELNRRKGIASVAARVGQVEATALTDGGVWEEGKSYRRSQVVQDHGAVWVCTVPSTTSRPPSDEWRLWVRRETRRDRR